MCCSRGAEIDASVLKAFCTGSNRYTAAIVDVPLLPPTSKTWLFSWLLLVWISVAVWFLRPGGGRGPVVATHEPAPEAGLKREADCSVVVPFKPPAASTRPSGNSVAV